MTLYPELPHLPDVHLELLDDLSPPGSGFLRHVRRRLRVELPDGGWSEPFVYDEVDRVALDAVVILAHCVGPAPAAELSSEPVRYVYLRSATRPPIALRDGRRPPAIPPHLRTLWEAPAGLIEVGDQTEEGAIRTAQRELHEELGFNVPLERIQPLGPPTFPTPGVIAERHYFYHVEVDEGARGEPALDGSALEAVGVVAAIPLDEALRVCRAGGLADAKTEIALRRFSELEIASAPRRGA